VPEAPVRDDREAAPRPPLTTTTSIKPAATVLAVGVAMLLIFVLINGVFDQGTTTTTTIFIAGGLQVDAANPLLKECALPGIPPDDIASGLIVPVDTVAIGPVSHHLTSDGSFDCSRDLSNTHRGPQILGFYLNHLRALGWQAFSQGTGTGGGQQYLFQKAGSDTFEWIEGVTVTRSSDQGASFTVRMYQYNAFS
jgi:hypothetical protein